MGSPSGCSGDSIGVSVGVKVPEILQVTRDSGLLANNILVEKSDGEGGGLVVYCSCWNALLGTSRTLTSDHCFISPDCLTHKL